MIIFIYKKLWWCIMKIPAELKELAEIFKENNKTLYIVGGFVRDSYLKIQSVLRDDIDLCSAATPKELKKILSGTKFEVKNINESVGVMAICGNRRYEHATFRKEIYESEKHTPDSVEFITSLEEDSKRRDFKINAIYFDILAGEYVDPLGGIRDLKDGKITTVKVPKIVFNDDPERILRLIRFSCSLGLEIPEEELFYAKQNAYKIKFISKYRLRNEFERLLSADEIYPTLLYTSNAHFRAMILLGELNIWQHIIPEMENIKKSDIVDDKDERIYEHTLNCLKNASPKIRLAVLLHDAGKLKTMELRKNFFGSHEFIKVIVEKNLGVNGLGYPKNIVERVIKTIIGYDFNRFGLASKKSVKKFIFENHDVIENIIEIKTVIKNENKSTLKTNRSARILRNVYNEMLKAGAPFDRLDLKVRGDDIIRQNPNVRLENLDTLIDNLLLKAALNPKINNKETLLVMANKMINSNRSLYLD